MQARLCRTRAGRLAVTCLFRILDTRVPRGAGAVAAVLLLAGAAGYGAAQGGYGPAHH